MKRDVLKQHTKVVIDLVNSLNENDDVVEIKKENTCDFDFVSKNDNVV